MRQITPDGGPSSPLNAPTVAARTGRCQTNLRSKLRFVATATALLAVGLALPFFAHAAAPVSKPAVPVTAAAPTSKPVLTWVEFQKKLQPFFSKNCADCHEGDNAESGIRFDVFRDQASLDRGAPTLEKCIAMLTSHKMPPAKEPQPSDAERDAVVAWLRAFDESSIFAGPANPGRVTIRRLNRAEYNNTIRDLLGIDFRPADAFPDDMAGYGFDNNGDVLTIAPVLMEKYLTAAAQSLDRVINVAPVKPAPVLAFDVLALRGTSPPPPPPDPEADPAVPAPPSLFGGGARGRMFQFASEIHGDSNFPSDGDYIFRFRGYTVPGNAPAAAAAPAAPGRRGGPPPIRPLVTIRIDNQKPSSPITVDQTFNGPANYQTPPTFVTKGRHMVYLTFTNGATETEFKVAPPLPPPVAQATPGRRNGGPSPSPTGKPILGVLGFEIEGPTNLSLDRMPPNYGKLFVAVPSTQVTKAQAAEKVIRYFANRAFRRPVTDAEMKSLLAFWAKADADQRPFEQSIHLTLQVVLASPQFLFRIEADPGPRENGIHTLTDFELASRLSYFLWNSMPDDELFTLASQGKLRANLTAQTRRMLQDPKAQALVENFLGQWLQLRIIDTVNPLPEKFPAFDESLRTAMIQETQRFFQAIVKEDRSVLDFIGADFTFVNARLAKHYGLPDITGEEFRRVTLPSSQPRAGVLTQASILTLTSYSNRTSPVLRGKWVLENLLNAAPPPPPPNVPKLVEDEKAELGGTLRQRLERHRTDPTCASCHSLMDPIGFGLENYDGIGAWRSTDANKEQIDATGKLPDGRTFVGADGLRDVLLTQKDEFVRCLTDRLLTFALGRGLERTDRRFVRDISANVASKDYKFSVLVTSIVSSDAFQKRAAAAPVVPAPKKPIALLKP